MSESTLRLLFFKLPSRFERKIITRPSSIFIACWTSPALLNRWAAASIPTPRQQNPLDDVFPTELYGTWHSRCRASSSWDGYLKLRSCSWCSHCPASRRTYTCKLQQSILVQLWMRRSKIDKGYQCICPLPRPVWDTYNCCVEHDICIYHTCYSVVITTKAQLLSCVKITYCWNCCPKECDSFFSICPDHINRSFTHRNNTLIK